MSNRLAELERQLAELARKKQVSKHSAIAKRRAKLEREIAELKAQEPDRRRIMVLLLAAT